MTTLDHHLIASATLRRDGRHDYRIGVVVIPGEGLALQRQWGPVGSLCPASCAAERYPIAIDAIAAIESLLARLHGRGYVAQDDVAPLLDAAALTAALRLGATLDAQALRALMWPDAPARAPASLADTLFP